MHREIEQFVTDCKAKMKKIGWSYLDLSKACGMHKDSFPRIFGPQAKNPSPLTAKKIAEALGVEAPVQWLPVSGKVGRRRLVFKPGTVIKTRGVLANFIVDDKEDVTLSEMEKNMKEAMICFRQGVALLEKIDTAAERAINEIAERMRGTSMLKKSLDVFSKH